MPDSFIPYGPDPATAGRRTATAARPSSTRDGVTAVFHHDEVVVTDRRIRSFIGSGTTFRTPGSAASPQNLFTIANTTGSAVAVELRELVVTEQMTAVVATAPPVLSLTRTTTMPSGGTLFTKSNPDGRSSAASAANVEIRQGASADGTLTAITATAGPARLGGDMTGHAAVTSGVFVPVQVDVMAHTRGGEDELVLAAGQAFVLQVITAAAAENVATRHFMVSFAWSEFQEF